jgi:hypothetical protein
LNGLGIAFGDPEYQSSSPYLNSSTQPVLIDFAAFEAADAVPAADAPLNGVTTGRNSAVPVDNAESAKKSSKLPDLDGWKCALFGKKKLKNILAMSQKWIRKLKDISQLAMSVNRRYNSLPPQTPGIHE